MKALILEHDVMMADLLETVVSGLYSGATVFVTGSVESALDYWSKFGVDLMITGWSLPDGLGLSVARAIRQKAITTAGIVGKKRTIMEEVLTETRATVIKIYRRGLICTALCVVLWKNAWFMFQKIVQP